MCVYGETCRKSFKGGNLRARMTRVTTGLCLYKDSDPSGWSVPAQELEMLSIIIKIK